MNNYNTKGDDHKSPPSYIRATTSVDSIVADHKAAFHDDDSRVAFGVGSTKRGQSQVIFSCCDGKIALVEEAEVPIESNNQTTLTSYQTSPVNTKKSNYKTSTLNYPKKKALLLHGSAGTGKTSLVLALAKEMNYEIHELNSSDLRNKGSLEQSLGPAAIQQSLFSKGKIILMDEVDGVTGTDRGGIPELVRTIIESKHPIVMTCNDAWQSKLSPVRSKSTLVELKKLDLGTIVSLLSRVAEKEGIAKDPQYFKKIAIKSQGDMRAALNDLQSYTASPDEIEVDTDEIRDAKDTIFNILNKLFKERQPFLNLFDQTSLSLDEIFLWIEENLPKEYKGVALAKAYYALGKADVFRGRIYRNQHWRFLIYQNAFQSAGISLAKDTTLTGFTQYERPKRVLKIWLNNRKTEKKKSIARKYARYIHCSSKRVMADFNLLVPILQNEATHKELDLSEDEIEYLRKAQAIRMGN